MVLLFRWFFLWYWHAAREFNKPNRTTTTPSKACVLMFFSSFHSTRAWNAWRWTPVPKGSHTPACSQAHMPSRTTFTAFHAAAPGAPINWKRNLSYEGREAVAHHLLACLRPAGKLKRGSIISLLVQSLKFVLELWREFGSKSSQQWMTTVWEGMLRAGSILTVEGRKIIQMWWILSKQLILTIEVTPRERERVCVCVS